jgi:hypothetical protein
MEIVFIKTPLQDSITKEPQLIDGKVYHWCVKSELLGLNENFQSWLRRKYVDFLNKNITHIFIYDMTPLITTNKECGMMIRYDIACNPKPEGIQVFIPFEPKKNNKFNVTFGEPFNIPTNVIKEFQRPSPKLTKTGIKWDDMVFTMYDPISPSTSQSIMDGLRELRKKDNPQIKVNIKLLGPIGDIVEEWDVIGEIDYIDFGHLDWSSGEQLNIKVAMKVQYAVLQY